MTHPSKSAPTPEEHPDLELLIPDVRCPVDATRPVERFTREFRDLLRTARPDMPLMNVTCPACGTLFTITAGAVQRSWGEWM